ncbi:MAG: DUF2147 domain-containing protein [Bacteroidales bacterium]|nr:DUF2147 domain-containing protein [Bacteroidales bacterium]MBN2818134.1 DUF2147 domain-containing protein [Bacteroidales bacterium]
MKTSFIFLLTFLFALKISAQEESVLGVYYNTEKTSKIRIFKATNGKFYGKIEWMQNPEKKDVNNPDDAKKTDPIMGMLIVKGFDYDAEEKQWNNGTIYDPDNGKTYDCFMWFEDGDSEILHVKGYIMGMKFAGREVEWTRTEL